MNFEKFNINLLYVEDDKTIRDKLSKVIKKLFQNVVVAFDGEDGIKKFKESIHTNIPIDLIITDVEMPNKNGFELLREVRKFNTDIQAIITSGINFGPYLKEMNSIDTINDYLNKPINLNELVSLVKESVKKIELRKEYKKQYNLIQQYKNALDNSAMVSKTDTKGIITYANDTFCEISGYRREELIGKNHNILRHPDVPSEIFRQMWLTIKAKMIYKYNSLPNKAKDGSTYYVNTTVIPILNINREISEYISIRFNTTALEKSILEEKQAKETQSRFLANMSHEIRTPLNGIIGFAKLLEESNLNKEDKEYIDIINSSAENLLYTINEILDISKIQTGNIEIENVYFSPCKEFEIVKKLFDAKAKEKNINFSFNLSSGYLKETALKGDIVKIKQVLSNLISNAIKFTPQNGDILFAIDVMSEDRDTIKLKFTVQDNGIGIDKAKQKDIFTPFVQEEESTTREYGGTGLGLAIVKDIVELLGGSIHLISRKGKGSIFYFELPFEYGDINKIIKKDDSTKITQFSGEILVAEDVKINQKLINALLSKKGLKVTFAANGLEAIEIFSQNLRKFSIIFLDINMPIMDGVEACKNINIIKQEHNIKNIPIVALTANAIKGDKERFLKSGFDNYISKPIDNTILYDILSGYLKSTKLNETNVVEVVKKRDFTNIITTNAQKLELPEEFYSELINDFLASIDKELDLLKLYIKNKDIDSIYNQAHKLKGVSGNLSLDELFNIFRDIEKKDISKEAIDNDIKLICEIIKDIKIEVFR